MVEWSNGLMVEWDKTIRPSDHLTILEDSMAYTLHVISHTHWDREWYLTFQQFRVRLVDLIDHVLDILDTDPEFKHFHLDGQTIVLEDYLQIRPQNERRIRKYVEDGRLLIGPWYQLNDEFLVSGESTVRSLLIGHRIAQDFGAVTKIGYLPDQFGNISQMPQIFREFGIDNCIFGRGLQLVDDEKMELYWQSPDGSEVLSSLMTYWYNNAQRFPADIDEAVEYTKAIIERMAPKAATDQLLLMNGVDHLEAQEGLPYILKHVNEQLNTTSRNSSLRSTRGDKLIHSTMPAYIEAVKKYVQEQDIGLRHVKGELREDRGGNILAGTLSSRMYLKQANCESEICLEKYAEPSSAFAWMLGKEYPADFLTYAWKLLMQNHPHDSICGCSIDQVHEEMMPRFAQVQQVGKELTDRSLEWIAGGVKTDTTSFAESELRRTGGGLVVFNPLSWSRTDRLTAEIEFPLGDPVRGRPTVDESRDVAAVELRDPEGNLVPYKLLDRRITSKQVLSPIELPLAVMVRRFTIEFIAEDVPACGYKTYLINPAPKIPEFEGSLASPIYSRGEVSNGFISASPDVAEMAISIDLGIEDGLFFHNLGNLEDGGDVGDEYRYVKPIRDNVITTVGSSQNMEITDNSPVSATIKLKTMLRLPVKAEGSGRSEETVECPVTSWLTIMVGSPRIDVMTEVENNAKDHRLRVIFPANADTSVAHAEGQFDVITRPIRPPKEWEGASTFFPQRSWVDVNNGERGLTIINKGLPEYEVYDDEARTIGLTLLRCVGRLSGGGDTPTAIQTPGAQCLGKHRFEYAILPHKGTWLEARVWQQAHQHNVPMLAVQTRLRQIYVGQAGEHDGELPMEYSFVEISPPELIITAIKKAHDRDALIVRFFNITDENVHQARVKVQKATSARTVNLNEEPGTDLVLDDDGSVTLDVPAKKIVTIEFGV